MEPKITKRDAFTIVGLKDRFEPEKQNFEKIWKDFIKYIGAVKPRSIDNAYYGLGFEPAAALQRPGCFGLVGMQERAKRMGASIGVESAPGQGTSVLLRLEGAGT